MSMRRSQKIPNKAIEVLACNMMSGGSEISVQNYLHHNKSINNSAAFPTTGEIVADLLERIARTDAVSIMLNVQQRNILRNGWRFFEGLQHTPNSSTASSIKLNKEAAKLYASLLIDLEIDEGLTLPKGASEMIHATRLSKARPMYGGLDRRR